MSHDIMWYMHAVTINLTVWSHDLQAHLHITTVVHSLHPLRENATVTIDALPQVTPERVTALKPQVT